MKKVLNVKIMLIELVFRTFFSLIISDDSYKLINNREREREKENEIYIILNDLVYRYH